MTSFDFKFSKKPVIAFKLPMVIVLEEVDGTKLDRPKRIAEPWVVLNATGRVHFLDDSEFLPLYGPDNDETEAYLESIKAVGV